MAGSLMVITPPPPWWQQTTQEIIRPKTNSEEKPTYNQPWSLHNSLNKGSISWGFLGGFPWCRPASQATWIGHRRRRSVASKSAPVSSFEPSPLRYVFFMAWISFNGIPRLPVIPPEVFTLFGWYVFGCYLSLGFCQTLDSLFINMQKIMWENHRK